ncbi:MAG: hypothetical protein ABR589_06805 [Chthoniobacterales bacterium]
MTLPGVPGREFAPVFDWDPPRGRKLSILGFIAASAGLHALCFYLFQIIYPPTVALLPPPARVHLITPDSEDGRLLLRWIEAEDPALSSTTQPPPDTASFVPPRANHVPSYRVRQPALKEAPPYQPDLRVPSARPPAPVFLPRAPTPAGAATTPSRLTFSPDAAPLGEAVIPPLQFTSPNREPPQTAEFRVAIGAKGEVRHCFVQNSSGDAALDEQARRHILLCRFPEIANRGSQLANALLWTVKRASPTDLTKSRSCPAT